MKLRAGLLLERTGGVFRVVGAGPGILCSGGCAMLPIMTTPKPTDLLQATGRCLDKLEQEYLKVGIDHCKGLEDHSQLSAFLMLGIRSRKGNSPTALDVTLS